MLQVISKLVKDYLEHAEYCFAPTWF